MVTETKQPQADLKENEMVQWLQGKSERHFAKLYDAYSNSLFGLILNWIGDREVSENILQDVFLKIWRKRSSYDASKGRIFTWLYNITRCACIDHLRSKAHKQQKISLLSDDIAMLVPNKSITAVKPDTIDLNKLVNSMQRDEKEIIELVYFKGFTQNEIARHMNIPLGTVKSRVRRAIKNLRSYFDEDMQRGIQHISLN